MKKNKIDDKKVIEKSRINKSELRSVRGGASAQSSDPFGTF